MAAITFWARLAVLGLLTLGSASTGSAVAATVQVETIGPLETVYDWKASHCDIWMVPDAPARAFVGGGGQVTLISANAANWYMIGNNLDGVKPFCTSAFHSSEQADPLAFDGHGWIESTYTNDGKTVVALISNDWWPTDATPSEKKPAGCAIAGSSGCHFYSVNLAISHDSGKSFNLVSGDHTVATTPYAGLGGQHRVIGFATAANLFKKDEFVYTLLGSRALEPAQSGSCLFRAKSPSSLTSWEYWDGRVFRGIRDPNSRLQPTANCAPVSVPFHAPVEFRSVSFYPGCSCYIGLFEGSRSVPSGKPEIGFFATTSANLMSWTVPQFVMRRPEDKECKAMLVYPSLLDPASNDRNFATIMSNPYMYFTRINRIGCRGTTDRDLVRVRVQVSKGR